jgi:5-methyltetrahydrofolate--homocysteine methyltransferase
MYNLENIEAIAERYSAFWEHEIIDRPLIAISCPSENPRKPAEPASLEQKWLDAEYRVNRFWEDCANTCFLADSLPVYWSNFGPGMVANFMGGDYMLSENTVWYDRNPLIKDIEQMPELKFDTDSVMWKTLCAEYAYFFDKNRGGFATYADLGGTIDIGASLLGAENLMVEMYDHPDELHALLDKIDDVWLESFRLSSEILMRGQKYYSSWLTLIRERAWYPLQADLSVMLSPSAFETFVVPSLERVAKAIGGKTAYHLDGRGEIKHIDRILAIPEIDTVEWVPDRYDGIYLDSLHPRIFPTAQKDTRQR